VKDDPLGLQVVLEDGPLRLEPLEERHREALREACGEDAGIWAIYGLSFGAAQFDASFAGLLANPARLPFAVLVGGELAGMTAWIDADPKRLSAEIGNTYLRPRCRGGAINGQMKRLLFTHGFACGLKRMQLSVDMRNERSRAACLKVGATFEGVLRNHYITWNGHERDSAIFSVVERDRERLGL
jgi:RimJ/RimL family protein N-acetyltransferase